MAAKPERQIEIGAPTRPGVKLRLEVEGFDLSKLDEATRETLERLLHDSSELIGDSLAQGRFPDALLDGLSNAQLEMHDIAAGNATSDRDDGRS